MGEYVVENEEAPLNDQFVMGKIDGSGIKSDSVAKINNQDRISVKRKTGR
ncbi:hypothetical protein [uncultured Chryseobacterium sp.]|nr:hypothetical protein [uncultured Chryseobacterium sp.]